MKIIKTIKCVGYDYGSETDGGSIYIHPNLKTLKTQHFIEEENKCSFSPNQDELDEEFNYLIETGYGNLREFSSLLKDIEITIEIDTETFEVSLKNSLVFSYR